MISYCFKLLKIPNKNIFVVNVSKKFPSIPKFLPNYKWITQFFIKKSPFSCIFLKSLSCAQIFFNLKEHILLYYKEKFSNIRLSSVMGILLALLFLIWREAVHQLLIDVLLFLFHSLFYTEYMICLFL